MPNPRLLAVVTALMMVIGAPGVQSAYTSAQLSQIEQLVLAQSWNQLRAYILANPQLLEGDDTLARELRAFLDTMQGGALATLFAAPPADILAGLRSIY